MKGDILERIKDLRRQATKEKSHYYVADILKECYEEILSLRLKIKLIKKYFEVRDE